jgi:predicted  nucleic acid-binding Zn-ribbon protein
MADRLGELITDVSRQMGGIERVLEGVLSQGRQIANDVGELRERMAKLEERKEWDGVDRREVKERLGSGDHTFQKLQEEVALMKQREGWREKELEGLRSTVVRQGRILASRAWTKLFWSAAIPAAVSILAALIMKAIGG